MPNSRILPQRARRARSDRGGECDVFGCDRTAGQDDRIGQDDDVDTASHEHADIVRSENILSILSRCSIVANAASHGAVTEVTTSGCSCERRQPEVVYTVRYSRARHVYGAVLSAPSAPSTVNNSTIPSERPCLPTSWPAQRVAHAIPRRDSASLAPEHELRPRVHEAPVVAERRRPRPREDAIPVVERVLVGIGIEQVPRA
jgi:hypothetical protein